MSTHCFANGNGRHARLITDLVLEEVSAERFSWGGSDLVHQGEARARYLAALRSADARDDLPLIAFCRS